MTTNDLCDARKTYASAPCQDASAALIVKLIDTVLQAQEAAKHQHNASDKARCPYCQHAVL